MIVHKRIMALGQFVSKDTNREPLQHIHINDTESVATDGHVLAIMPHIGEFTDDCYPAADGCTPVTVPVLVKPSELKPAVDYLPKKPALPQLNYIQMVEHDGKPVINAGLPVVQFPIADCDENYPNYKQCVPDYGDQSPLHFALDGALLKKVCDLAVKYGSQFTHQITFEIPTTERKVKLDAEGEIVKDADGNPVFESVPISYCRDAIKFDIKNDGQTIVHGLIMPLRILE